MKALPDIGNGIVERDNTAARCVIDVEPHTHLLVAKRRNSRWDRNTVTRNERNRQDDVIACAANVANRECSSAYSKCRPSGNPLNIPETGSDPSLLTITKVLPAIGLNPVVTFNAALPRLTVPATFI